MTNEHKDLPALPGPQFRHHGVAGKVDYFTANQMRAIRAESYDIGYSAALAARPEPAGAGVESVDNTAFMGRAIAAAVEAMDVGPGREWDSFIAHIDAHVAAQVAKARPADDDRLWDQTLLDRDTYHEWADRLADGIAKYLGIDIGEHSNQNLPWAEAAEAIEGTQENVGTPNIGDMVNRFLGWKLPTNFNPDCGVSFKPLEAAGGSWPIGTNLLSAEQAKAMFEHCVQSAPQAQPVSDASESACKMCGDTPRIAAQRLMLKERFANREPSPATADFDLPPACIEEPPTAPDAGRRDAALEEAAKVCDFHATWSKGEAEESTYSESSQKTFRTQQFQAEKCAGAIRALKTVPAKPQGGTQ